MIQLICLSEQCIEKGLILDLQDILLHIHQRHELMDIKDFNKEFKEFRTQVKDLGVIKEFTQRSIAVTRKFLDDMQNDLEQKFAPIQILTQFDLEDYGIQDAIRLYKQFKDLNKNNKDINEFITQDLEAAFTKLTTLFSRLYDNFRTIDAICSTNKQITKSLQQNIEEGEINLNSPKSFKSCNDSFDQLTKIAEGSRQLEIGIGNLQNNYQNLDEQIQLRQQVVGENQLQLNSIPNQGLYRQVQQFGQNLLFQPEYILQQQQQGNQVVNNQLIGIFGQQPPGPQLSQLAISNAYQPPLQQQFYQDDEPSDGEIISQVRFSRYLSEEGVVFSDYNTDEADIDERKYLICDNLFLITDCSLLDLLIVPNSFKANIKIGIVCLNRWNPNSIEKYKRTQETYSNRGNPYLFFLNYSIDAEYRLNLRVENKMFIDYDVEIDLEELGFSEDDECSFYIELKHCKVMIE